MQIALNINLGAQFTRRDYLAARDPFCASPALMGLNVAYRRSALESVGGYDETLETGEDVDLSWRFLKPGKQRWKLFVEPGARIQHQTRASAVGCIRQWFGYSLNWASLLKRFDPNRLNLLMGSEWTSPLFPTTSLLGLTKFPIRFVWVCSPFSLLHVSLAFLLVSLRSSAPTIVSGALSAIALSSAAVYFSTDLNWKGWRDRIAIGSFRYALQWTGVLGGFIGGVKNRMFFFGNFLF